MDNKLNMIKLAKGCLRKINELSKRAESNDDKELLAVLDNYTTELGIFIYHREMSGVAALYVELHELSERYFGKTNNTHQKGTSLK